MFKTIQDSTKLLQTCTTNVKRIFTKLYTTFTKLTKLHKETQNCTTMKAIRNFTIHHKITLRISTKLYETLQHCSNKLTILYTTLHNFTQLYTTIHNYTQLDKNSSKLFKTVHNFTNTLHNSTRLYNTFFYKSIQKSIHMSSKLYTM